MLIEFAITNFRSIKDKQVLSMLPSDRVKKEERKNQSFPIIHYKDLHLLTVAAIFGRNSGGKSNIIKAFKAFEWFVLRSHLFTQGSLIHAYEPFMFDIHHQSSPCSFEIDFIAKDRKRYFYFVQFNKQEILNEELYYYVNTHTGKTTKRKLFVRRLGQLISYGDDFKGLRKPIEERTRTNVLFLSKSISENSAFLAPVFDFFKNGFSTSNFSEAYIDLQIRSFSKMTADNLHPDIQILNNVLNSIDTGILQLKISKSDHIPKNVQVDKGTDESLSEEQRQKYEHLIDMLKTNTHAVHRLFEGENEIGVHDLPLGEESEGTQKFIAVFSQLIQALKKGNLFIMDEFDKSFHPLLTKMLLRLLANPKSNPNGAQLIFSTHHAHLMDDLDTDQINLLQKDFTGATEIYTVSDIRGLRSDVSAAKRYLRGDFEAIPNINDLSIQKSLEMNLL